MKRKKNKDQEKNWSHKNDYPIEEVWNTDNTIAQLIVPRLQAFKALDKHGYCPDVKIYKENPNDYKGSIIDISMIIRVALTSKSMTPDLYEIMKLLGVKNIKERIEKIK